MKSLLYFLFPVFFLFLSCDKEEAEDQLIYDYHAHIHKPGSLARHLGDTLHIEVEFESHTGETVHHVNVRILHKDSKEVIYNKPDEAHVHASEGAYDFEDTFILSETNKVSANQIYVLEASVWGHEDDEQKETSTVEFRVDP